PRSSCVTCAAARCWRVAARRDQPATRTGLWPEARVARRLLMRRRPPSGRGSTSMNRGWSRSRPMAPSPSRRQQCVWTAQRWILPGRPATQGDGWVLELPGLVVDLVEPAAHQRGAAGTSIRLAANVALMCGCPIEPGGIWDAARYDVRATILRDGRLAGEVRLSYGGRTGYFTGAFPADKAGAYA